LDNVEYKVSQKDFDGRDGGIVTIDGRKMRSIEVSGFIYGGSSPLEPLLDTLKANFAPKNTIRPLYFTAWGINTRQVFCKALGMKYSWEAARRYNSTPFTISWVAEDPIIYGTTEKTTPIMQTGNQPGYTFSHAFNYSFGGLVTPASPLVVNAGNAEVGFLFEFSNASIQDPIIISATTNSAVSLNLTVAAQDAVVVDFYNEMVTVNGSARRNVVDSEGWFKLQPGENSIWLSGGSAGPSQGTVRYYDGFE
jgi:hypothetical protein